MATGASSRCKEFLLVVESATPPTCPISGDIVTWLTPYSEKQCCKDCSVSSHLDRENSRGTQTWREAKMVLTFLRMGFRGYNKNRNRLTIGINARHEDHGLATHLVPVLTYILHSLCIKTYNGPFLNLPLSSINPDDWAWLRVKFSQFYMLI